MVKNDYFIELRYEWMQTEKQLVVNSFSHLFWHFEWNKLLFRLCFKSNKNIYFDFYFELNFI